MMVGTSPGAHSRGPLALPTLRASPIVIPGCARLRADPESSTAHRFWIPGSREDARPGMTV
jgi:hypothetical protein